MLNAKHEKFINNLVKGMSQRQAYKDAFPNSKKWKDATIDNNASKLFNKSEIMTRYKELMQKLEDEAIMTAQERRKWLTEVVKGIQMEKQVIFTDGDVIVKDVEANLSTKIKALDTLNKMDGQYITNHKISGDSKNPISIIDLSHLSTEEIRELLKNEDKK
ncbi:MAG: terminase [Firmicutes bacterium]|nr:terminase [Bacillota bacterium]